MGKPLRRVLAGLCLLGAIFFLLPLAGGILHFGMLWPAAVLLAGAAALRWPESFRRLLRPRWLRRALSLMAAVCAAAILVTLGKMAAAAGNRPAADAPCTVVVLGCQVLEDGRPSLMLQGRVQAAYDYLAAHPDAVCIASGGQNGTEPVSEARCIRQALADRGIGEGRILLEERSRSTEENLAFSAAIIREQGLPTAAVIASDSFHQLRAAVWAERNGLTPYAAPCAGPWFLTAGYWAREAAALLYMAVTNG